MTRTSPIALFCSLAFVATVALSACEKKSEPSARAKTPAAGPISQVEGVARNAKMSAAVVNGDRVVYCFNHETWAQDIEGKRVVVEGQLEVTGELEATVTPSGEVSQGSAGGHFVIRRCRVWMPGPSIRPVSKLLDWFQTRRPDSDGKRTPVRIPVVVSFEDEHRLWLERAFVGASATDPSEISLRPDDSGLGIPLIDRLRRLCDDDQTSCVVWLEGYWGSLLELLAAGQANTPPYPFAVLDVFPPDHRPLGNAVRVLVEKR